MKRKFVALLLAAAMLVTCFGGSVLAGEANSELADVIRSVAARSAAERKSMTDAAIPLIITDTGLDALEYYVGAYDTSSTHLFDAVIGKLLNFADKQTIMSALGYLRVIDEGIREDYFIGFQKRTERQLSNSSKKALEELMQKQCDKYDGLEKILAEDSISVGAVARLLEIPYQMNGQKPLLTNAPNGFALGQVDATLKARLQAALDKQGAGINADELLSTAVSYLNEELSPSSKLNLKSVLAETGVYKFVSSEISSGSGSGGAVASDNAESTDAKTGYSFILTDDALGYDVIEIYYTENGVRRADGALEKAEIVSIDVSSPNVMLYKITSDGFEAVRYCTYSDGVLKCKITELGDYALRIVYPYFDDVSGWSKEYVEALYNRGIISGKGERMFAPDENVTREEFVKLVVETAGMTRAWTDEFDDVAADAWYAGYIGAASKNNIVNGVGDRNFGIGENITRQDMAKLLYGMLLHEGFVSEGAKSELAYADSVDIAPYAREAVGVLSGLGIISGDESGNFMPTDNATRAQAAKLIYKLFEFYV